MQGDCFNALLKRSVQSAISHPSLVRPSSSGAGPSPTELIQIVARDIQKTRQCKVRLCMRFTPVQAICAVNLDDIRKVAADVVWPSFDTEVGKRFAVAYEHRASTGMDRLAVIKAVADGIRQVTCHLYTSSREAKIFLMWGRPNCVWVHGIPAICLEGWRRISSVESGKLRSLWKPTTILKAFEEAVHEIINLDKQTPE